MAFQLGEVKSQISTKEQISGKEGPLMSQMPLIPCIVEQNLRVFTKVQLKKSQKNEENKKPM